MVDKAELSVSPNAKLETIGEEIALESFQADKEEGLPATGPAICAGRREITACRPLCACVSADHAHRRRKLGEVA